MINKKIKLFILAVSVVGLSLTACDNDRIEKQQALLRTFAAIEYTDMRLQTPTPEYSKTYYVRPGAGGTNDGSDWTNAFTAIPATLERGAKYYIADGSYGASTFNTPASGGLYIGIIKATAADHGTSTGWSSGYGDGQAAFTNIVFDTNNWEISGQQRTNWSSGYTIVVTNATADGKSVRLNRVNYIILRYLEMTNSRGTGLSNATDDILYMPNGSVNVFVQYSYLHNVSRNIIVCGGSSRLIFEHNKISDNSDVNGDSVHGQGFQIFGSSDLIFIRNNWLDNISGTAYIACAWGTKRLYVYGNVFSKTGSGAYINGCGTGTIVDISEPQESGASKWSIFNNSFVNLDLGFNSGVVIYKNEGSISCFNNLWYDCAQGASLQSNSGEAMTHDYNTLISTDLAFGTSQAANETVSTAGSPFVDWQNGNFKLTSATVGGTSIQSPFNLDPEGTTRGNDGTWDRGAYEF